METQSHLCSLWGKNMFGGRVQITRDEKISGLAQNVYSDLARIAKQFEPVTTAQVVDNFATLPLISVEQAMKELIEMENEINEKEPKV